jgi:glycosyltransferase involved in cell wall biosynthesis
MVMCSATVADSLAGEASLAGYAKVVISNAVQSAYFTALASPASPQVNTWGMVARLDMIKDHETLLKAVPLVARLHSDFRLTLVGEGLTRPALEKLIRELGIVDKVTLAGAVARPWERMAGWRGAIFSTGPQEGFGIAAAEAMAMGLPCVFTDLPVMREVGGAAVLYARAGSPESLAEQINTLIEDEALAARLGQAAGLRARECFSPQAFAAAYLRAFELTV